LCRCVNCTAIYPNLFLKSIIPQLAMAIFARVRNICESHCQYLIGFIAVPVPTVIESLKPSLIFPPQASKTVTKRGQNSGVVAKSMSPQIEGPHTQTPLNNLHSEAFANSIPHSETIALQEFCTVASHNS